MIFVNNTQIFEKSIVSVSMYPLHIYKITVNVFVLLNSTYHRYFLNRIHYLSVLVLVKTTKYYMIYTGIKYYYFSILVGDYLLIVQFQNSFFKSSSILKYLF